jgi:hypothetical protein
MANDEKKFIGTITIWEGKIQSIHIEEVNKPPLLEITQILAAKKMMEKFLEDYENNYKRT